MSSNFINNYVFHYNQHAGVWSAIPRDMYKEYWNDFENPHILKSRHIELLIEILDRIGRAERTEEPKT